MSFLNILILALFCLCFCFSYTPRTTPYTPSEYIQTIKWGFDTDIFKANPPLRNYNNPNNKIMQDLVSRGVGHLRLRSRADVFGYEETTFNPQTMEIFLIGLETVVGDMIKEGIHPIISWINHPVEGSDMVTSTDEANYVNWWRLVAKRLASVTYELSFNLFTELESGPLRDPTTYNSWTSKAVDAIRATGGFNIDRIIILGSPGKDSDSLTDISETIYKNKNSFLVEWHLYASGPNKKGGQKNWVGTGSASDRENVDSVMETAVGFTQKSGLLTWIGAWMPYDNIDASLNQEEIEAFGCYFSSAASKRNIPWAMNKLDNFYDTETNTWIQTTEIGRNANKQILNVPKILEKVLCPYN